MGARNSAPSVEDAVAQTLPPPPPSPPPQAPVAVRQVSHRKTLPPRRPAEKSDPKHVIVVVLGDVGRSPRMQYHAMSLAAHGVRVTLLGYGGERCISPVETSRRIAIRRFEPPLSGERGKRIKSSSYLVFAVMKAIALVGRLLLELVWRAHRPDAILVQNPPSLPGLACVYLACLLRRCHMVLDWHNLGFTVFDRGPRNPLVWITRRAEGFFGRKAEINLTVSRAMRNWIRENFAIASAHVLYDRPPDFFRSPTLPERHDLFWKLAATSPEFADAVRAHAAVVAAAGTRDEKDGDRFSVDYTPDADAPEESGREHAQSSANAVVDAYVPDVESAEADASCAEAKEEVTLVTTRSKEGAYRLRHDRPALLVSSTSWTPDEDFSVLLEALGRLDARAASGASPTLPFVVVIVTGKGPQKAEYLERMRRMRMSRVAVCTAWLEPDDYPVLLGSADVGICLHTSTSGVDLPMKVVDMFGCGVPVCAVEFKCLKELVQDGYNGSIFRDSTQLALQLEALLDGFPRAGSELNGYRNNVREVRRWQENWDQLAWPLLASLGLSHPPKRGHQQPRRQGGPARSILWTVENVILPALIAIALLQCIPSVAKHAPGWPRWWRS